MNLSISGNGLASKVLILLLSKRNLLKSVSIIEKFPQITQHTESSPVHYIGLWGPSLHILNYLGILKDIRHCNHIQLSSYRNPNGIRLSKPYSNLVAPMQGKNSLIFVNQQELLETLDHEIESLKQQNLLEVQILPNQSIASINRPRGSNMIEITTNEGQVTHTQLLIAADGMHSQVRQLVHPNLSPLVYRGYKVYKGHVRLKNSNEVINTAITDRKNTSHVNMTNNTEDTIEYDASSGIYTEGFQTWGPSKRFASVPTQHGNAWFLAVTSPPPSNISLDTPQKLFPFSFSSNLSADATRGIPHSANDSSTTSFNLNNNIQYDWGSLQNGSFSISQHEWSDVITHMVSHERVGESNTVLSSSWHHPVLDMLQGTNVVDIRCSYAFAFDKPIPGGLSGVMDTLGHVITTTSPGYNSTVTGTNCGLSSYQPGVAFVGDAAHTLDPILAQGAGVAIEDAALLVECLSEYRHNHKNISETVNLSTALAKYEQLRSNRIWTLHHLSNLSQSVGHIDSKLLCHLRDQIIMAMNRIPLPRVTGELIFDQLIRISTESNVFKLYR